jgi:predicted nucleotidyltransferase
MNDSSLDLARRADLAWLAVLIRDLQVAMSAPQCLLVGAMARDLWLYYAHGISTGRATTDVDFAVAVASWADFDALHETLIASGSFRATGVAHRLQHVSDRRVDLIPFGRVAGADGIIAWPPDGAVRMSVAGYDEARASAVHIRLPDGVEVGAVTLPALMILKIHAWADRHAEQPRKDAYDLYLILRSYLDAGNAERFYRDHRPWMEQDDFDYGRAGAKLAGLDVRNLLQSHSAKPTEAINGLLRIVEPEIDADGRNSLVGELRDEAADFREHLIAFVQGLSEGAD